ncbi:5197_t:CDS:2 [Acaulospora morrowiae]|uniref:5197_t:CDS:1 n=1 Tax=Acaulospora morrowiae TaxID=94023 RepID=A0A9N9GXM1_9GLOM|nr:5197_t:CDS:2 [Acaulospora morrowiae]
MADPNSHQLNQQQHYLTRQQRGLPQHQLVGSPGIQHLIIDPQTQQQQVQEIRHGDHDFKVHQLPLARIKKVMKTDEEVKMISAEAPILFAKGCDIFITELTMRAWFHAEECKRRTLQRSDIANAIKKIDMFDFLIDIVPREEKVNVKTEKMEYQDQNPYGFGMGMSQGGTQFDTSSSIPVEQKMMVDPINTQLHEPQHLQHVQYVHRMESQLLHDHPEQQNNHNHQQLPPPFSLPPLNPVAGQQTPSSYRNTNRPPYAEMNAGTPVRQTTTEQTYQQQPSYYNQPHFQHPSTNQQHLDHMQQRQSDNHSIQVKYEYEPPTSRPVEWYSQPAQQHVQESSHISGQQSSSSPSHEGDSMQFTRHDEGFGRVGSQRN